MIRKAQNKLNRCILLLLFSAVSVFAADYSAFQGGWGTDAQCARSLITSKGTKHWTPFEISADWLQYGDVWCRLNWVNSVEVGGSTFATAEALCGEDDSRNYRINFNLSGEELTLIWNNDFENSGLRRCLK